MRHSRRLRKANRSFLLANVALALMVILIACAFLYWVLPM